MGKAFDPGPDDLHLAALIASLREDDFDEAAILFGTLAIRARSALIAYARKRGARAPDIAADEAIARGYEKTIATPWGRTEKEATFVFKAPYSLASWLRMIVYHVVSEQRRKTSEEVEFDDSREYPEDVSINELAELANELGEHLAVLDPMERFVLIAYQQLERRVGDDPIDLRACGRSAGLSQTEINTLVRRATMADLDLSKRSLTQKDVATLLDKSDRTVRRMLKAMRDKLLGSYRRSGAMLAAAE